MLKKISTILALSAPAVEAHKKYSGCKDTETLYVNAFTDYKDSSGNYAQKGIQGAVEIQTRKNTDGKYEQRLIYQLTNVDGEKCVNGCGIHIHAGESCGDSSDPDEPRKGVGPHYWNKDTVDDPWFSTKNPPTIYKADQKTNSASGVVNNIQDTILNDGILTDLKATDILGKVVVIHTKNADGTANPKAACGRIERRDRRKNNVYYADEMGPYPESTLAPNLQGIVRIISDTRNSYNVPKRYNPYASKPGRFYAKQTLSVRLSGLSGQGCENGCGIHIHEGKSCDSADLVLGHYWNKKRLGDDPSEDPWNGSNVKIYTTEANPDSAYLTDTIDVVTGIKDIRGRTVVVHNKDGARIGCGIINRSNIHKSTVYVPALTTYPLYSGAKNSELSLLKSWTKPSKDSSITGSFNVITKLGPNDLYAQDLDFELTLTSDLETNEFTCGSTSTPTGGLCGIHIHEGTSCEDPDGAYTGGPHYWAKTRKEKNSDNSCPEFYKFDSENDDCVLGDPWFSNNQPDQPNKANTVYTTVLDTSSGKLKASGTIENIQTNLKGPNVIGRVVVVHAPNGQKAACGVIRPQIQGEAKIVTKKDNSNGQFYQELDFSLTGLDVDGCGKKDGGSLSKLGVKTYAAGTYDISGSFSVKTRKDSTSGLYEQDLEYDLGGLGALCTGDETLVGGQCGIHIHEGTSCEDSDGNYLGAGHYWNKGSCVAKVNGVCPQFFTDYTNFDAAKQPSCYSPSTPCQLGDPWFSKYQPNQANVRGEGTVYVAKSDGSSKGTIRGIRTNLNTVVGNVVVVHDASGAKAACGVIQPKSLGGGCGIHIHEGFSCDDHAQNNGHFWNKKSRGTSADPDLLKVYDEWKVIKYEANYRTNDQLGKTLYYDGVASNNHVRVNTDLNEFDILHRVMTIHGRGGKRLACGAITAGDRKEKKLVAKIGAFPGCSGSGCNKNQGKVKIFTTSGATIRNTEYVAKQSISHNLKNLDLGCQEKSCGFHIHSGDSCKDATRVGGHYWDADLMDPWSNSARTVYFSDANGKSNTMKQTEAMALSGVTDIKKRTFVLHRADGAKVGCGRIRRGGRRELGDADEELDASDSDADETRELDEDASDKLEDASETDADEMSLVQLHAMKLKARVADLKAKRNNLGGQ